MKVTPFFVCFVLAFVIVADADEIGDAKANFDGLTNAIDTLQVDIKEAFSEIVNIVSKKNKEVGAGLETELNDDIAVLDAFFESLFGSIKEEAFKLANWHEKHTESLLVLEKSRVKITRKLKRVDNETQQKLILALSKLGDKTLAAIDEITKHF